MGGTRTRHPLVDLDTIELVLRLDPEFAFDERVSRPLLRGSLKGMIPDEVRLRRSKSSFDQVFHAAIAGSEINLVREVLRQPSAEIGAFVNRESVNRELLDPPPPSDRWGLQHWAITVWRLFTAECWLRSQSEPEFPAALAQRAYEVAGRGSLDLVKRV